MATLCAFVDPRDPQLAPVLARLTQSEIRHLEREGHTWYAAARTARATTALIVTVSALATPLPGGENVALSLQGEGDNPGPARASRNLTRLLTPADGLFAVPSDWRARCAAWQARLKVAQSGEQLLGEYPDAEGHVGYNPEGKEAFERDARRFLKAVLGHLGWFGKVTYNKAGIACSGEAAFHAHPEGSPVGVFVEVDAGGGWVPAGVSPSGVRIMWRLEPLAGQDRWAPEFRNQWARWDVSATDLAERIAETHRLTVMVMPRSA